MLKKVGENSTKRLRIIPAKMYAIEDIYPKYACPNCEGSGDEDKPVFRQQPAVKYFIPKSIATNELLAYVMTNKFCELIHVACLAHVRRKFYDSSINGTSPGAGKALKYIQQIYKKREPGKITRRWLKFDAYDIYD